MGFELKKTTDVIANFLTLLRKCGDVFLPFSMIDVRLELDMLLNFH